MLRLEPASADKPTLRRIVADIGPTQLATGFVAMLFGATGPLAIILSVGTAGGLTPAQISSFVFGAFAINGAITLVLTWAYRQPLAMFWTIPGVVLMGPALTHLSYQEVVGAFHVASLVVLALGLTGLARQMLERIPMPIVMAMVAGIFLRFGLDIVRALHGDPTLAGPMVFVFFALLAAPRVARLMPPLIGAFICGAVIVATTGRFGPDAVGSLQLAQPVFTAPVFSPGALVELVAPLVITVVLVQHGQGLAVLKNAGHSPPITAVTVAAGLGGLLGATVGAVCTSLTGPTNGLITSAGPRDRHYATAMVTGVFAILFGLLAPAVTQWMLAAPKALILTLGGLAMLRTLHGGFMGSFRGPFSFGAMICFIVTVADLPILNIGSAFWGLVSGIIVSLLVERQDFRRRD